MKNNYHLSSISYFISHYFYLGIVLFFVIFSISLIPSNKNTTEAISPPNIITYQGKLLQNGSSVTTAQDFAFIIYDSATAGNALYTAAGTLATPATISITPTSGVFSVNLGGSGTNTLATSTFANNHTLYLEVRVGGTTLTPRKQITSVPYALNSEYLMGIPAQTSSGTTHIVQSDTNGNFLFQGNAQNNSVTGGLIILNPSSTPANATMLGIGVNGTEKFRIDEDGDVFTSGTMYATTGLAINSSTPMNTLSVNGTAYITGTTTIDDVLVNRGKVVNPVNVGSLVSAGIAGNDGFSVSNNYLYLVTSTFGIFDVSDPTNPTLVGLLADGVGGARLGNGAQDVKISGNYAYVISDDSSGSLEIIDISNPSNPVHTGAISHGEDGINLNTPWRLELSGNYAYITTFGGAGSLTIVDVSDPKNPKNKGSVTIDNAYGIAVFGKYAYVGRDGNPDSMEVVDISDPANPVIVGSIADSATSDPPYLDWGNEVFVQGNYVYVSATNDWAVSIIDISDPTNPTYVASLGDWNGAYGVDSPWKTVVSGGYAYVANSGSGDLVIFDVTSSSNPIYISSVTERLSGASLGFLYDIEVSGNYVYILDGGSGGTIEIIDVSGATISNVEIGTAQIGNLQVLNYALFDNSVYIKGGLSVGNSGLHLGGDFAMYTNTSSATMLNATNTLKFSNRAHFIASSTNGTNFIFESANTLASSTDNILFSVRNNGTRLFSISANGDAKIDGNIFASSTSVGTPGTPGDLAEKVDISGNVEPGDVMTVDISQSDTYEKTNSAYQNKIAGVISGNPTLTLGNGKTQNQAPLAIVGRVPVKVQGTVKAGDYLTPSDIPGVAQTFDSPEGINSGIIGIALQNKDITDIGKVLTLLQIHSQNSNTNTLINANYANNANDIENEIDFSSLSITEQDNKIVFHKDLDLNNNSILNVKSISGLNFEIDSLGNFIVQKNNKPYHNVLSDKEGSIIITGSGTLNNGQVKIIFSEDIQELIQNTKYQILDTINITATLTTGAENGIYIAEKDKTGFVIKELNEGTSSAGFDWVVILSSESLVNKQENDLINEEGELDEEE